MRFVRQVGTALEKLTTIAYREKPSWLTWDKINHIHTVRECDFDGDFGRDLLKEHYHSTKHEHKNFLDKGIFNRPFNHWRAHCKKRFDGFGEFSTVNTIFLTSPDGAITSPSSTKIETTGFSRPFINVPT
jgi:hypothetical protein